MARRLFRAPGLIVLAAIMVIVLLLPTAAYAGTITLCPSRFNGPVEVDGQNAPPGTTVTAWIEGTSVGPWTVSVFSNYGGTWYVVDVPADDPDTLATEGGVNGDTVHFAVTVGGTTMPALSGTWQIGSYTYHPLRVVTPPVDITTTSLPEGKVGDAYLFTLEADGGKTPYTWTAPGLPAGLSVAADGTITGTPTEFGDFTVEVTVTDSFSPANSDSATLSLYIWLPGDANGDGVVSIGDATWVEMMILSLVPATPGADANLDGVINGADVTWIELIIQGLVP